MPTRESDVAFADEDAELQAQELEPAGEIAIDFQTEIPSVLERVRELTRRGDDDPAALTEVDAAEVLDFYTRNFPHEREAAQLTTDTRSAVEQHGLWQNILLNLRGYEEGDPEPAQRGPIPIAELHVPPIQGCSCRYFQSTTAKKSSGLRVKIRGVGGGAGRSMTVKFAREVTSKSCVQACVKGEYVVTPWYNADLRSRIDVVQFTGITDKYFGVRGIPGNRTHSCGAGVADRLAELQADPRAKYIELPIEEPEAEDGDSEEVETDRELTLAIDGILEMKSSFAEGFKYEWRIVGAANYLRFFEPGGSHVQFWAWDR